MVREKKSIQVEMYTDAKRGVSIPICYNPNPHKNYHEATVDDERFTHTEIEPVRRWVKERIKAMADLVWQPIITVTHRDKAHATFHERGIEKASVTITFTRWWLARLPTGELRRADWEYAAYVSPFDREEPRDTRTQNSTKFTYRDKDGKDTDFAPPCRPQGRSYRDDGDMYHYPYDEALWAGLERMQAEIEQVNTFLTGLLTIEGDAYLALAQAADPGTLLAAGEGAH